MAIFWLSIVSYMQELKQKTHNALRWSEKYTKTDMIYLARGGFWLSLNQISGLILSFVVAIVFANTISKDAYGYYKYLLSLAGLIGAFTLTGLGTAIVRSVANGKEYLARRATRISLTWSIPMVVLGLAGSFYYLLNGDGKLALGVFIITIFQPLLSSTSYYNSFLNGRKEYRILSALQVIRNTVPATLILVTLLVTDNVLYILFAYFFSNTVVSFALNRHVKKKFPANEQKDDISYGYAKKLSLINFLSLISQRVDSLLIFHFIGAGPLAIYAFASALPDQIIGLFKNIYTLSLPKFSSGDTEQLKRQIVHKTVIFSLFSLFIAILYSIVTPILFRIFFPAYTDSIRFSQIISLNIVLSAAATFVTAFFDSQAEARNKTIIITVSNVVKVVLMFLFVQMWGLWGIIISELIARTISILIAFYLINRNKKQVIGTVVPTTC